MNTAAPASSMSTAKSSGMTTSCTDNAGVSKRLQSELMSLMMAKIPGVSAFPEADNLMSWVATIHGPADTPYAGLKFKLSMKFPATYPYNAPAVKFETPCYHPNIDMSGNICLDILKDKWSAVYNVQTVLLSLQSLLGEPNNESPTECAGSAIVGHE
ncbi:hypothetical protein BASA62_002046 [Batrachochytrium salamandrivorans]|nr:hypothetical protein BASA62_002046 [Batrachochytrium salamandrivorans]